MILLTALLLQAQAAPAAVPAPKPKKEHKICRSAAPTGSMIPERVCHTEAEWKAISQGDGISAQDMQHMSSQMGH